MPSLRFEKKEEYGFIFIVICSILVDSINLPIKHAKKP